MALENHRELSVWIWGVWGIDCWWYISIWQSEVTILFPPSGGQWLRDVPHLPWSIWSQLGDNIKVTLALCLFFSGLTHVTIWLKKKILAALFLQEVSQPSLQNSVCFLFVPPAPASNKLTSILEEIGRYLEFHKAWNTNESYVSSTSLQFNWHDFLEVRWLQPRSWCWLRN